MAGKLGLTSPWARQALPVADRPAVEAEIPDGGVLGVSVSPHHGRWRIWLNLPGRTAVWRMDISSSVPLADACLFALRHHAKEPEVAIDA